MWPGLQCLVQKSVGLLWILCHVLALCKHLRYTRQLIWHQVLMFKQLQSSPKCLVSPKKGKNSWRSSGVPQICVTALDPPSGSIWMQGRFTWTHRLSLSFGGDFSCYIHAKKLTRHLMDLPNNHKSFSKKLCDSVGKSVLALVPVTANHISLLPWQII